MTKVYKNECTNNSKHIISVKFNNTWKMHWKAILWLFSEPMAHRFRKKATSPQKKQIVIKKPKVQKQDKSKWTHKKCSKMPKMHYKLISDLRYQGSNILIRWFEFCLYLCIVIFCKAFLATTSHKKILFFLWGTPK